MNQAKVGIRSQLLQKGKKKNGVAYSAGPDDENVSTELFLRDFFFFGRQYPRKERAAAVVEELKKFRFPGTDRKEDLF